ncbi:two-component system response regulator [Atopomonas sediminilitoris]|uniref:two-component system response regulator n=1 Tax=Atopomonas sediminilitoris TaxID=2919919 RepID=UPI001F4E6A5B|nr:EAL domain-containing protein [Atopomonas sediminilitoris]MCJ8168947.1 EAL domain-containing protein [Atopomonas sediminilitoris]
MHLYLLEDSPTDGDLMRRFIQRARPEWHVHIGHSLSAARSDQRCQRSDVLLLDLHLPDGSGLDLLLESRAQASNQTIVMLTGQGDEESAVRALKAGADDYIAKRGNYLERLPELLEQACERRQGEASVFQRGLNVLYVEHDAHDIDLTYRHLRRHAPHIELEICRNAPDCEQRLSQDPAPDVLLIDYRLPGDNAIELIQRLHQQNLNHLPIILITGQGTEEVAAQALRIGVSDYVVKHAAYLFELPAILEKAQREHLFEQKQIAHIEAEQTLHLQAAVFRSSHNGILIADLRRRIISVNPALCRVTGYQEHELIGQVANVFRSGLHGPEFYQNMWYGLMDQGFWEGEIWNKNKQGEVHLMRLSLSRINDTHGLPRHYVAVYTDLSQLHQAESQLQYLSHHDQLTGLANRLLLVSRLEQLFKLDQHNSTIAILHLDLNNFSRINDSLGQASGDQLLRLMAQRFSRIITDSETLARLGSDEFLLLVPNSSTEHAAQRANALLACCHAPFELGSGSQYIHACIGVSLSHSEISSAEELLIQADAAMHKAKQQGQQHICFYHERDTQHARKRLELENRLRRALANDEFHLHYQPLAQLGDNHVIGAEALLRWQPAQGEALGPSDFIPVLEESGLITEVGQWVLDTACRQTRAWLDQGFSLTTMAVNLSTCQLRLAPILEHVQYTLQSTGLAAHYLELEVTESGLLEHSEQTLTVLQGLRDLGVRIAVDDFGTGYSSLAYLSRLPLDKLKIDRSFITQLQDSPRDASIVRAIIAMARSLDLHVLAEGVENESQARQLLDLGAQLFQGYWLSPPIPAEQFAQRFLQPLKV